MGRCEIGLGTRFWLRHDQLSLAYGTARASPCVFVPGLEFLPTFASNENGSFRDPGRPAATNAAGLPGSMA
jgi:hypothetical protein